MGLIAEFLGRVEKFQPSTWFGHLIVSWLIWMCVDILPKWGVVLLLSIALGVWGYREYLNYQKHRGSGHKMRVWIGDGVGDMIGPLTVLWAAMGNPWVAHTFGLAIMGIGTVVWVGLGYAHYGGRDA